MLISYRRGQTGVILRVKILNSGVTTGAGLTNLSYTSSGLVISTIADNESTKTAYTVAGSTIETITTLGTYVAPTATKCRFKEVDATYHPGLYEIQIADARFAVSNAKFLIVSISGATSAAETDVVIPLQDLDPYDAVRANLSALPNANAAASGGLLTYGSSTGQLNPSSGAMPVSGDFTSTMKTSIGTAVAASAVASVTGNVGGNVTGSVGSVTGAVGSVTAAVSVAGDLSATMKASVTTACTASTPTAAAVTGAVGSVTGNVGGNVTGSVGSVVGNVGGNVVGSTASVTGAVGSVTGNVGGNVTGSVGSISGVTFPSGFSSLTTSAIATAVLTTQMTESYNTDGTAPTLTQALMVTMQRLTEFAIASTSITVKKLDGVTTAYTLTMDAAASSATSSTRTG